MIDRVFAAALISLICLPLQFSMAQPTLEECGSAKSEITCSFFFNNLDAAFKDHETLYTLRKFFFQGEMIPITIGVFTTLAIKNSPNISCSSPDFLYRQTTIDNVPSKDDVCSVLPCTSHQKSWRHQWSRTILSFITAREHLDLLQDTNSAAYSLARFNSFDSSVFSRELETGELEVDGQANNSQISSGRKSIYLSLKIDFLPCLPDEEVLLTAMNDILIWISVYAMYSDNIERVVYRDETIGFAFLESEHLNAGLVLPILTVIHVLVNAIFALASTYLLAKYHGKLHKVKGKQYQVTASLYWALVFMCFIGATAIIAGNCYLYYILTLEFDYTSSYFFFRFTNDAVLIVLVIIELFASFCSPHDPGFFIPSLIRRLVCCNQCCGCCGSVVRTRRLRFTILSISMWIIVLFLQLLISSLLPVAVVTVGNPVPSIALVSVMIALFFCLVVFLAYFLNAFEGDHIATHRMNRKDSTCVTSSLKNPNGWVRNKLVLIAQAFIFLVIFAIMALIVIIFLSFVRAGANTNSILGLIFSLAPSAALGAITWGAKMYLFKELEEEDENENEDESEDQIKQTALFKLGGVTLNSKLRNRKTKGVSKASMKDKTFVEATNPNLSAETDSLKKAKEDDDAADEKVMETPSAGELESTSHSSAIMETKFTTGDNGLADELTTTSPAEPEVTAIEIG